MLQPSRILNREFESPWWHPINSAIKNKLPRFKRMGFVTAIHFFVIGFIFNVPGCRSNSDRLSIKLGELEKIRQIKLTENKDHPIGRIFDAAISSDSILHLLDLAAADIKLFKLDGTFIRKLCGRGDRKNDLSLPRTLEVTRDYILVADMGLNCTKWFDREGKLIREVFVNGFRPVIGNTKLISENRILHAALWDGRANLKTPVHLIDSTGKILQKLGKYPKEYSNYALMGNVQIDFNLTHDTYIITFNQSPAIFIGNLSNGNGKLYSFDEERAKYISTNRSKNSRLSEAETNKLTLEEAFSDRVLFLTDSIFIRSYFRCTEESLRKKSLVLPKHCLQAYSIAGEFLSEVSLPGRLHGKFGDHLLLEESDEPDNHIFGLYKVNFEKTLSHQKR